jgi:hypothetical protein
VNASLKKTTNEHKTTLQRTTNTISIKVGKELTADRTIA